MEVKERRRCARCGGNAVRGSDLCFQHDSGAETTRQRAVTNARKVNAWGSPKTEETTRLINKSHIREIKRLREIVTWCMERMILLPGSRPNAADREMLAQARLVEAQMREDRRSKREMPSIFVGGTPKRRNWFPQILERGKESEVEEE